MIKRTIAGAVVVLLVAAAALWWAGRRGTDETGIAADLAQGQLLYGEHCAACHGAELEGQPNWKSPGPNGRMPAPPHDATGHTWHHSDRLLLAIMREGTSKIVGGGYESDMPGFGEHLSDEQLWHILEWIKSQWPERERTYQTQITAQDTNGR